jgi:hypothetical protein
MNVLAHEPHSWFLLDHQGRLLLDVNCSYSAFSYPMLFELLPSEAEAYRSQGIAAISHLAQRVQLNGQSQDMQSRNITAELGEQVMRTIETWLGKST